MNQPPNITLPHISIELVGSPELWKLRAVCEVSNRGMKWSVAESKIRTEYSELDIIAATKECLNEVAAHLAELEAKIRSEPSQ